MSPYELSKEAELDLDKVTEYTQDKHGAVQTLKYVEQLDKCAINLAINHGHYRKLPKIHPQLRVKHCQHHYIFGVMRESYPMLIVAVFHDRMKLLERQYPIKCVSQKKRRPWSPIFFLILKT